MSGQPNRNPNDPADFRQDYMDALNLRAKVDDYNLQANKQYKATGALPPAVTQMTDTRNTSEILADTYKLKQSIIDDFKDLASPAMASLVVQRIEQDPLNGDGSFLQFVAQNAPEIVAQLKKKYKFGIKGDSNDVETMVSFMRNMYASIKDQTGTVKSFFDKPYGSTSAQNFGLLPSDYQKLQSEFTQLSLKILRTESSGVLRSRVQEVTRIIQDVCLILGGTVNLMANCEAALQHMIQDVTYYNSDFIDLYNEYRTFISNLPKPSQIRALIGQLNKASNNVTDDLSIQIVQNIQSMFPSPSEIDSWARTKIQELLDMADQINTAGPLAPRAGIAIPVLPRQTPYTEAQVRAGVPYPEGNPSPPAPPVEPPPPQPRAPPDPYGIKPYVDDYVDQFIAEVNLGTPVGDVIADLKQLILDEWEELSPEDKRDLLAHNVDYKYLKLIPDRYFYHLDSLFRAYNQQYHRQPTPDILQQMQELAKQQLYDDLTRNGAVGLGLKKRRGRPVGCGIGKSQDFIETKVDKASGIKKNDIKKFVPFGKYFIHNVKLKDNIISLRQPSGVIVAGMSPTRVSDKLGHVIRTIVGGGTPKFNELNGLSDEERDYLYKVSKKSDLEDKFSVPSPSKDAMEKDIHNFEVMKGEIMAGNDSIDMIKKFKLLILKLSKNGSLPKNDVHEILQELIVLGY